MKNTILLLLFIVFIKGKDILLNPILTGTPSSLSHFQCVKNQYYEQIAIWLPMTEKGINVSSQIGMNVNNAGLKLHLGFYPCRAMSVDNQSLEILKYSSKMLVERVWLQPFSSYQNYTCTWDRFPSQENCAYIKNLIFSLKDKGFKAGVIANFATWPSIFGSIQSCPEIKDELMAWLPSAEEQNHQPNF